MTQLEEASLPFLAKALPQSLISLCLQHLMQAQQWCNIIANSFQKSHKSLTNQALGLLSVLISQARDKPKQLISWRAEALCWACFITSIAALQASLLTGGLISLCPEVVQFTYSNRVSKPPPVSRTAAEWSAFLCTVNHRSRTLSQLCGGKKCQHQQLPSDVLLLLFVLIY